MPSDAEKVVSDFCKAWSRRYLDEILGYFTEDAVYHNVPVDPAKGKKAIAGVINSFLPMASHVEFRVMKSASNGNIVFNERMDIFHMGQKVVELPVAGVFEVTNGKISLWRDYFDMQMFTKQTQ